MTWAAEAWYKLRVPELLDTLKGFSALGSTLAAFGMILVLARFKVPLSLAVLAGTVALAALFRMPPGDAAVTFVVGATRPITIGLVVITVLLLALSEMMRASGQLAEIVSLAGKLLRRPAVSMAALPALIGLLPMPGGALFSAPMVESAAGKAKVSGARLSAVNYWFRHIWEHWWPLYPGVMLAVTLTKSTLGEFMAFQIPLGLSMAVAGLLIFRGTHPDLHATAEAPAPGTLRKLLWATSSIWVIMIVWGACWGALELLGGRLSEMLSASGMEKYVLVTLGLLASLIWTARLNRLGWRKLASIFGRRSIYALTVLVVTVMVFQYTLKKLGAAEMIHEELAAVNVPVVLMVVILPFVAGMVTGLAIGFVGTSFPIVLALAGADGAAVRPYAVLAYGCGHIGMMLSPLHVCHVVSNRYFKTSFGPVYRRILPSVVLLGALEVGYFLLLRVLMGG